MCGENTHLAKNCPSKNKKLQANNEATSKKRKLLEQNTSTDIDDLDDTKRYHPGLQHQRAMFLAMV